MTAVMSHLSGRLRAPAVALACAAVLAACARSAEEVSGAGAPQRAASPAADFPGGGPGQPPPAEAGLLLLGRGDLAGAEPLLVSARRQAPDDARVLEGLGAIYARTDRLRQAEDAYRAALAKTPGSTRARLGLASVLVDSGRYDEARAALVDILKIAPDDPVATLKLALLEARSGSAADAEAGARRVLAGQPDNPEAHYVLGLALGESGRLEEALREMRRTEELEPGHLGALSHLVTFSVRLGRPDEAERWRRAGRS
jgi:Flp pilus assembly protein TadD